MNISTEGEAAGLGADRIWNGEVEEDEESETGHGRTQDGPGRKRKEEWSGDKVWRNSGLECGEEKERSSGGRDLMES